MKIITSEILNNFEIQELESRLENKWIDTGGCLCICDCKTGEPDIPLDIY